jgi:hypothetical protein
MHLIRVRVRLTVDIITPFVGYHLLQTRLFLLQLDYGVDNLPLEKKGNITKLDGRLSMYYTIYVH